MESGNQQNFPDFATLHPGYLSRNTLSGTMQMLIQ